MAIAGPCKVSPNLPGDVKDWSVDHVENFLTENKVEYALEDKYIEILKKEEFEGIALLAAKAELFQLCGIPPVHISRILHLVSELKLIKGLGEPGQNKRKISPSNEDIASRIKRQKVVKLTPSSLARPSTYESIQRNSKEKILDDRPQEDDNIPPVSLLYDGFGQFLDIVAGNTDVEGFNDVKAFELQLAVDEFAQSMCGFFKSEDGKREKGLYLLDKIFASRKDSSRPTLAASIGVRTNGHHTADHTVATMITEFKNQSASNSGIPEAELVGYFARSFAQSAEDQSGRLDGKLDGWRAPGLGITIVGPDVKFYALLSLDTQFRLVSLTPALSCIRSASEGGDRDALYRAFTAASVLLARILKEVPHHQLTTGEFNDIRLPSVSKLLKWHDPDSKSYDSLEFQITEPFNPFRLDRYLYLAKTRPRHGEKKELIIVKFVRQYCPELHDICARSGHAPALYAYERLPGGWYGVAMEYASDTLPVTIHECISEHFERWKTDLQELVEKFHNQGFVHGDLRDANIISGDDGCVKLVDFDWGGRDGEVSYPTPKLNRELVDGRSSEGLRITKADDLRILQSTLEKTFEQIPRP